MALVVLVVVVGMGVGRQTGSQMDPADYNPSMSTVKE